ncbi:hypothetical protein ACFWA9_36565 [Kitasatospora sp. NPDC059973]|uniref:hypothetical protein n=1 Tax=Kitasatospora sp. NPDC059973 TaxID=3347020 RepID=UPI00369CE770
MRSGRLFGLGSDTDAADLAAVGLIRLATGERLGAGARPWLWQLWAASFADTWLAFADPAAPGLRVPAGAALHQLVRRAAELVLLTRDGDGPAALELLGRESAEAYERSRCSDTAHPVEPVALALLWHGVQAATADGPDAAAERECHDRRIAERSEAYVRRRHRRQDTLALILACARSAATALAELSGEDPGRAAATLEEYAIRSMAQAGPVPLWVPGRPGQLTS